MRFARCWRLVASRLGLGVLGLVAAGCFGEPIVEDEEEFSLSLESGVLIHNELCLMGRTLSCCQDEFGTWPIVEEDQAICAAMVHGLPGLWADAHAFPDPYADQWRVYSGTHLQCDGGVPHAIGVVMWVESSTGELAGAGPFSLTLGDGQCE